MVCGGGTCVPAMHTTGRGPHLPGNFLPPHLVTPRLLLPSAKNIYQILTYTPPPPSCSVSSADLDSCGPHLAVGHVQVAVWDGSSPSLRQSGHFHPFYHVPAVGTTSHANPGGQWAVAVHKRSCSRPALLGLFQGLARGGAEGRRFIGGCGGSIECVGEREGAVAIINTSSYPPPLPDHEDVRYLSQTRLSYESRIGHGPGYQVLPVGYEGALTGLNGI